MTLMKRTVVCVAILSSGIAAQAALERISQTERPVLKGSLSTIPMVLGEWAGVEQPVHPDIIERCADHRLSQPSL